MVKHDGKRIGLGHGAITSSSSRSWEAVKKDEAKVHKRQDKNTVIAFSVNLYAAFKLYFLYLITLETILMCFVSVGLTVYWYFLYKGAPAGSWSGGNMNWIILGFAVITPMTTVISMAFKRREQALHEIARIRAACFQIYIVHQVWDWKDGTGRATSGVDFLKHTDEVLSEMVALGDELRRFLKLPNFSMTHHRVMRSGRHEAAEITEVGYHLLDSVCTKRIPRISELSEYLKSIGLSASELSRARQYELFIVESVEKLRQFKTYRTPQALRAFGRIFTVLIPPIYAPSFAQLAMDLKSLPAGIIFALMTPLCLFALLESLQALEDPFVGWVGLDGIDVDEEFETLHNQQLINVRMRYFPDASHFISEDEKDMHTQKENVDEWDAEVGGKLGVGTVKREVLMRGLHSHQREANKGSRNISCPDLDGVIHAPGVFSIDSGSA